MIKVNFLIAFFRRILIILKLNNELLHFVGLFVIFLMKQQFIRKK